MELNKKQKISKKLAEEHNSTLIELGVKLYDLMERTIEEHSELDENGDLKIDKEIIYEEVLTSEKCSKATESILEIFYDKLVDRETYEKRQAWRDRRDRERTDRIAYSAEKNRVANKVNKRNNND